MREYGGSLKYLGSREIDEAAEPLKVQEYTINAVIDGSQVLTEASAKRESGWLREIVTKPARDGEIKTEGTVPGKTVTLAFCEVLYPRKLESTS